MHCELDLPFKGVRDLYACVLSAVTLGPCYLHIPTAQPADITGRRAAADWRRCNLRSAARTCYVDARPPVSVVACHLRAVISYLHRSFDAAAFCGLHSLAFHNRIGMACLASFPLRFLHDQRIVLGFQELPSRNRLNLRYMAKPWWENVQP